MEFTMVERARSATVGPNAVAGESVRGNGCDGAPVGGAGGLGRGRKRYSRAVGSEGWRSEGVIVRRQLDLDGDGALVTRGRLVDRLAAARRECSRAASVRESRR